MGKVIWGDLKHQIYLGSSDFVVKQMKYLKDYEGELSEVPIKQRKKPAKTLDEYKRMNGNRNKAIVEAYQSGGYTMEAIANYFGCHYSTVSRMVAKYKT